MASNLPNLSDAAWSKLLSEELIDKNMFKELLMKQVSPLYVGVDHGSVNLPSHGHSYSGGAGGAVANRSDRWSEANLHSMLASRFNWGVDAKCPFRRVLPVRVTDDKIVVFVVTNIDALLLYDDPYLYPSDALMSQLRLLGEAL